MEELSNPQGKNIFQRLNAIKKAVAYIQRDKEVTGAGSYMAVTHDAVTAATRGLFVEHGVLVVPVELTSAVVDSGMVTGKGNPIIRFEAKYRIDFVNVDVPEERVSVEITAHALDQGDKAPGKALSYSTKMAVLKILQLETGEDEESREATKPKKHSDIPVPNSTITPTTGAWEALDDKVRSRLTDLAVVMKEHLAEKNVAGAVKQMDDAALDADQKVAIWTQFDSKQRAAMKREKQEIAMRAIPQI